VILASPGPLSTIVWREEVILYALHVFDMIKGNWRNRERPYKMFINCHDGPEIKQYCQENGLEGIREPKFVVAIDRVPIYLDPSLEQGYAAYQMTSEQSHRRVAVA
jgi:hypothetical protein